jgi:hypothetical protein
VSVDGNCETSGTLDCSNAFIQSALAEGKLYFPPARLLLPGARAQLFLAQIASEPLFLINAKGYIWIEIGRHREIKDQLTNIHQPRLRAGSISPFWSLTTQTRDLGRALKGNCI